MDNTFFMYYSYMKKYYSYDLRTRLLTFPFPLSEVALNYLKNTTAICLSYILSLIIMSIFQKQ